MHYCFCLVYIMYASYITAVVFPDERFVVNIFFISYIFKKIMWCLIFLNVTHFLN